jgi:Protein of unknown function (DUF1645)
LYKPILEQKPKKKHFKVGKESKKKKKKKQRRRKEGMTSPMENFTLNAFPSIRESISVQHSEAPQNHAIDGTNSDKEDLHYDPAGEGFSFGISTVDNRHRVFGLTADEMFHHGRIISFNSVSNHNPLSMDDTDASPIQRDASGESFDVPKTAPGSPVKSWSTGSIRRRPNTVRELLLGGRSHSDGKEKLVSFEKGSSIVSIKKKNKKKDKGKGKQTELKDERKQDYTKNGEKGIIVKPKEKDVSVRRRSFLPFIGLSGGGPMLCFH